MTSLGPKSQEGLCLQAIAVVLQHQAVAEDQRNICTLLQVSKAWREVVQQSAASLTDVIFDRKMTFDIASIHAVFDFAWWLLQHIGLIRNLSIFPDYTGWPSLEECLAACETWGHPKSLVESVAVAGKGMQSVIERVLKAAAAITAAAPAAAGTVNILGQQLSWTWPSRPAERSFISSVPPTAAMLAALPAATLTSLELDKVDNNDWYLGLSQLTNLQQMRLDMRAGGSQHSAAFGCLIAISNLKMLTALKLQGAPPGVDTTMLPVQLQELDLQYQHSHPDSSDDLLLGFYTALADLQHLTCLQQLQLDACELAPESSLPCNLSHLKLSLKWRNMWEADAISDLSSLDHLTSIELDIQHMDRDDLEPFKQLTQLRRLSMIVGKDAHLFEVADAWEGLPLSSLQVWHPRMMLYSNVEQLMQRLEQATTLTKLDLDLPDIVPDGPDAEKLAVCEHLSTLTNLQELDLSIGFARDFVKHDAQHLAALVTLTSLYLWDSGPYMDATTLCLLAVKLTNLKVLQVGNFTDYRHEVGSMAALPAMGRLTTLERLILEDLLSEAARRGLQLLTDLTKLTELDGFEEAGEEALQGFWNSIKLSRTGSQ